MQRIYDERRKGSEQQVVQSAGEADNVFIAHSGTGAITIPRRQAGAAAAEVPLPLPAPHAEAGGVVHADHPDLSYLPYATSLTGALITVGGGALALHSKRTTANLTKAAEDNE
ncbi:hypothetical protein ACFQVA_13890 [Actinomadura keratinilytica]